MGLLLLGSNRGGRVDAERRLRGDSVLGGGSGKSRRIYGKHITMLCTGEVADDPSLFRVSGRTGEGPWAVSRFAAREPRYVFVCAFENKFLYIMFCMGVGGFSWLVVFCLLLHV